MQPQLYWLDADPLEPEAHPTLIGEITTDLCIVGAGYTGLWTALLAKEKNPERNVIIIEQLETGAGASGRNGGFCSYSLTHGFMNGYSRFKDEMAIIERLGRENLEAIEATIKKYNIDCDWERTGAIDVAMTTHPTSYLDELRDDYAQLRKLGQKVTWLDRDAMQEQVHSPLYTGGLWRHDTAALIDPARLVWGLKATAESLGVRIYEDSKALSMEKDGVGVLVTTPLGRIRAGKVALATNAFKPVLKRLSNYVAPVYDYCMVTEPLTQSQLDSIGWKGRQGLSDIPNQFHYYRLTEDNRILWGGYDAVYFFAGKVRQENESRPESWAMLSQHFFETFPQLEGVRFSHMWGGVIDTCSRYCVFWGKAMGGRVSYALGYTGLGVAASRFGAEVMLDLIDGRRTRATATEFVRTKPVPFPPEPFRFIGIQATRWSLDHEDKTGTRNTWLRTLDRFGLGWDS